VEVEVITRVVSSQSARVVEVEVEIEVEVEGRGNRTATTYIADECRKHPLGM
jgi:hypothetical protein